MGEGRKKPIGDGSNRVHDVPFDGFRVQNINFQDKVNKKVLRHALP